MAVISEFASISFPPTVCEGIVKETVAVRAPFSPGVALRSETVIGTSASRLVSMMSMSEIWKATLFVWVSTPI